MLGREAEANDQARSAPPGGERDDASLLALVSRGDLRAFEALFRSYQPRLTRFLRTMLRNAALVEEVLDDTMLVVWTRPERYNGQSKVSTWIFAIAYRKALKALRRRDEPVEDRGAEMRPSEAPGPDELIERLQASDALRRAIAGLSDDHRAVVDLTYFHEFGYREIAEILRCPVDTVKTRMFHARRHLKTMLAGRLADWL